MSNLNITVESFAGADLVTVSGRVDSNTAPQLDEQLEQLMNDDRHKIVVNLADVGYMSSAGLRALVAAKRECSSHRGDVRLSEPSDRVEEVLTLAGLDSIFEVFNDDTAAIGSYT